MVLINAQKVKKENCLNTLLSQKFLIDNNIQDKNFEEIHYWNMLIDDCLNVPQKYGYVER